MDSAGTSFRHVGIAVPQDVENLAKLSMPAFLESAEHLGYDGLWVSEANASGVLDPIATLNFAAGLTRTVCLGVAVLLTARRSPLQLARELATIDQLSRGRLIVGVGLGKDASTYAQHGVTGANRVNRFEAGVEVIQRLWTEDRITSSNDWWQLEDVERPLATCRQPHPPIWFGARRGAALRRAAKLGDGWIGAGSASPTEFAKSLRDIMSHLHERPGGASEFAIAKRVYVHVGKTTPSLMSDIEGWFRHHYGEPDLASRAAVVGTAEECIMHLRWLRSLGVDNVILHPVLRPDEQMRRLARELLPVLRGD